MQPALNRLTRDDQELRLEPKVMQVLEVLAETPGEVVTRETLEARVWAGTYVSEDVLQRAIRELRKAFGDDAANPKYVETIRKRGYRLIAPVRHDDVTQASATPSTLPAAPPASARPRAFASIAVASVILAATISAVVLALASREPDPQPDASSVRFVALTSSPLNETDPAMSPDGTQLAFAMRPDASDAGQADIYITDGPGRTPQRLIAHPSDDRYPSWSPDATTLAFNRINGHTCDLMVFALPDRHERRIGSCGNSDEPRVSWSGDGEWLVESYAPQPYPIRGWRIARVSVRHGTREELTLPPPGTLGDYSPAVSPDGTRIAFVRGINGATADLYVIPFDGGESVRITTDNQDIVGVDWSADGGSLLFATDRAGGYTIWRAPLDGTPPRLVVGGAAKLKHPSVSRTTGRLTYESWSYEINLWEAAIAERLDLEADLASTLQPAVQSSDQWNHSPDISPDGRRVAFVSTRSGGAELWISDRDGNDARQLTTFGRAALRQPRWSPDGSRVLVSAGMNGRMDLYVIDAAAATATRLTDDDADEIAPAWWHDGSAVMFGARTAGTFQLIRMTLADRTRTQLTTSGGYAAQAAPDGTSILFTRLEDTGIWTMPIAGGEPRLLVPDVRAAETANWRVTGSGIYYVGVTADQPVIRRAPLTGGGATDVAWLGNYSWPGVAVTPDGSRVLYAHWDRRESNIMGMDQPSR